jgi:hypothetical protein
MGLAVLNNGAMFALWRLKVRPPYICRSRCSGVDIFAAGAAEFREPAWHLSLCASQTPRMSSLAAPLSPTPSCANGTDALEVRGDGDGDSIRLPQRRLMARSTSSCPARPTRRCSRRSPCVLGRGLSVLIGADCPRGRRAPRTVWVRETRHVPAQVKIVGGDEDGRVSRTWKLAITRAVRTTCACQPRTCVTQPTPALPANGSSTPCLLRRHSARALRSESALTSAQRRTLTSARGGGMLSADALAAAERPVNAAATLVTASAHAAHTSHSPRPARRSLRAEHAARVSSSTYRGAELEGPVAPDASATTLQGGIEPGTTWWAGSRDGVDFHGDPLQGGVWPYIW